MLLTVRRLRGFTLIELMVSATIAIILLVMLLPNYVNWTADSEIRNGAQSIANGLRLAQNTAIARNNNAQFVLTPTGWTVAMVAAPLVPVQVGSLDEGSKHATVFAIDALGIAATTIAFDALGQVIPSATNVVQVDVTAPTLPQTRPLRILVGNGRAGIKLCDPGWAWPDPKGCPP